MIINKTNEAIINTKSIYIHDDILHDLVFNRKEHKLHLSLSTASKNDIYTINYLDVLGFEMSSCDFWGWSPHIYHFVSLKLEEYTIIPKLMKNEHFDSAIESSDIKEYMETKIIFTSGDELVVACKSIEYNKANTKDGSVCSE